MALSPPFLIDDVMYGIRHLMLTVRVLREMYASVASEFFLKSHAFLGSLTHFLRKSHACSKPSLGRSAMEASILNIDISFIIILIIIVLIIKVTHAIN